MATSIQFKRTSPRGSSHLCVLTLSTSGFFCKEVVSIMSAIARYNLNNQTPPFQCSLKADPHDYLYTRDLYEYHLTPAHTSLSPCMNYNTV